MVQGSVSSNQPKFTSWDNTSRKSGFHAMQSKEQEKKEQERKQDKKANPWGPVFKDRKNFVNMHNC